MSLRTVVTLIGVGGITATQLASNAVTTAKIADDAITSAKIGAGEIGNSDLAANAVDAAKMDLTDAYDFANLSVGAVAVDPTKNLMYAVVKAVQLTNVTLSGGTPNSVAGYNLSQNDDILAFGQTDTTQNGIYNVGTVGSGSNGTWARDATRDSAAEYPVGMLVYDQNTQKIYKLTDFGGTLGTDPLVFEEHQEGMQVAGNGEPVAIGTGDGSTLTFDMAVVATIVGAAVFVDGILQDPSLWSISNGGGAGGVDRLAFSSGNAPASGAKVEILAFIRS